AIWQWHDGERAGLEAGGDPALPRLVPGSVFLDLDTTLIRARYWHAATGDDEALTCPDTPEERKDALWRRHWIPFLDERLPLVLDGQGPEGLVTFRFDVESGRQWVAQLTVPQRVAWWHRYVGRGAWDVDAHGRWVVHPRKLPRVPADLPPSGRAALTEVT
ncbi:SMI1/KNR4 family protein, partial [Cellulomonas bogoriensis]|uniref:hypothetical protein n=1 Tax=Cellulomonas bogoriensis TaxID=301388 RepID=UPI0018DDCFDA